MMINIKFERTHAKSSSHVTDYHSDQCELPNKFVIWNASALSCFIFRASRSLTIIFYASELVPPPPPPPITSLCRHKNVSIISLINSIFIDPYILKATKVLMFVRYRPFSI